MQIDFLQAVRRPEQAVLALCERPYYDSLLSKVSGPEPAGPDPYNDVILQPATLTRTEVVTDALGSFEVEHEMVLVGTFSLQVTECDSGLDFPWAAQVLGPCAIGFGVWGFLGKLRLSGASSVKVRGFRGLDVLRDSCNVCVLLPGETVPFLRGEREISY
jgi:hypothetical protein